MYLKMNWTSPEGIYYENCCIVISSIIVLPEFTTITTNWQPTKEADDLGYIPILQPAYSVLTSIFDPGPIYGIAYNHLLTLPEFENAQLVLDIV